MSEYGGLDIGWFEYCINAAGLAESVEFYGKLGFRAVVDDRDTGYAIMVNGEARIGLFKGHIERNLINFRGGDVFAIAEELKRRGLALSKEAHVEQDGSAAAELIDPDGNVIYLNTFPGETKSCIFSNQS